MIILVRIPIVQVMDRYLFSPTFRGDCLNWSTDAQQSFKANNESAYYDLEPSSDSSRGFDSSWQPEYSLFNDEPPRDRQCQRLNETAYVCTENNNGCITECTGRENRKNAKVRTVWCSSFDWSIYVVGTIGTHKISTQHFAHCPALNYCTKKTSVPINPRNLINATDLFSISTSTVSMMENSFIEYIEAPRAMIILEQIVSSESFWLTQ